ncbi:hypothetical protein [Candidatus Magnetomonas plexicatena]|uniref:hypothetical protein n=1 Tax=Candidatus Magnetomonas plexicatena TaxID=2552947 RepID=UPI001C74D76D|nr:hypothetical protein E2O03_009940 [Nitrospirales bacterium LBB_01]
MRKYVPVFLVLFIVFFNSNNLYADESKATESELKSSLYKDPVNTDVNLKLGLLYYNEKLFNEALDYFENVVALSPGSPQAAEAEVYIDKIKKLDRGKLWFVNFSAGVQYDSNVILASDNNPLPSNVSRKNDWKEVFYFNGGYSFIKTDKLEAMARLGFYQSINNRLKDYNVTQSLVELSMRYNASDFVKLDGKYGFEYVLVGGNRYDYDHYVSPSVVLMEDKDTYTTLEYRYKYTRFIDGSNFLTNSDRTGGNHLIGLKQRFQLFDRMSLDLGYAYDKDFADTDYWKYDGNKGFVSFNALLPLDLMANLSAEYYRRDYNGKFEGSSVNRTDNAMTYSGSLTKILSKNLSLSLAESYTKNNSNTEAYSYDRNITSLFVNVRF